MSNSTISPNMNLTIPTVGVDPGPDWANNVNASLSTIDGHNHTPGNGVQIPPAGLNINSDLTFQSNNATNLRSVRFTPQVSPITAAAPDLGCLYEAGVDLYYNDGNGNQIRITQSGTVAGASGTITGLPSGTASASYSSGTGTFIFQQATSTAANMDIGTLIIRYPGSYPAPSGNYIALEAPSSLSSGYALVLPTSVPASSNALVVASNAGVLSYVNVDNSTITISGGTMQVPAGGITSTQIQTNGVLFSNRAARSYNQGATPGALGNVAITFDIASFSTTSTTPVAVQSTNLTSQGGPVQVGLFPDGNGSASVIQVTGGGTAILRIIRNGSFVVGTYATSAATTPVSAIMGMDFDAPAGTNSYELLAWSLSSGATVSISNAYFEMWEL